MRRASRLMASIRYAAALAKREQVDLVGGEGGQHWSQQRRVELDGNSIPACPQSTPHCERVSRRAAITIRHTPLPLHHDDARWCDERAAWCLQVVVEAGNDSRGHLGPVIHSMPRRPAETCRLHHMPIWRPRVRRAVHQTAIGSKEPMRATMLQRASLPLHSMFCREYQGQHHGWVARWRVRECEALIGRLRPGYQSISGSQCTRLGGDSP